MPGDDLLSSLKKYPILIEQGRSEGEFVAVAAFSLAEVQLSRVHVRQHCEFGFGIVGFKKLRAEIESQLVYFFLRKDRILNFLLCLLGLIFKGFGCVITAAGLHAQLLRAFERGFESVKTTIELKTLR